MSEPKLHRWTQRDGSEWACAAYDHGPLCRLCTKVEPDDNLLRAMLVNVENGNMEVRTASDGQLMFEVTEKGKAHAREVVEGLGYDPDNPDSMFDAARLIARMPDAN